jgi:hypothetical protein
MNLQKNETDASSEDSPVHENPRLVIELTITNISQRQHGTEAFPMTRLFGLRHDFLQRRTVLFFRSSLLPKLLQSRVPRPTCEQAVKSRR